MQHQKPILFIFILAIKEYVRNFERVSVAVIDLHAQLFKLIHEVVGNKEATWIVL